jgi:HEAT repeat protein
MAIKILCPTCGAANTLDDAKEGKTVRCRKCEEKFTVEAPRPKRKADDEDDDRDSRRAPRRSRVRDDEEDDRPRRRRARDDDDDDDDRPRRRAPKKSSGSGTVLIVLGSIAAVLILVCGGGGLLLYFAAKDAVDEAQAQMPGGPGPAPAPLGGGPIPPPALPPQQPQPGLQVNNVDDALAALKENERWRQDNGLRWLANAQPDEARRAEVVAALGPIVPQRKGTGGDSDINALASWGGKDSLPTLIEALHAARGKAPFPADVVRTQAAIRALGNFKDPNAAPALVEDWYVGGGQDTTWALRAIGPAAQKDVLPAFDHPNDQVREAARNVLQSYRTPDDTVKAQALADLADKDWARRGAAASWFAEAKPNDADRAKVVKALDGMLADALALNDPNFARDVGNGKILQWPAQQAANALVKWAGKDDLAALGRVVKLPPHVSGDGIYDALARTGDEKAVALLIERARKGNPVLAGLAIKGMGATGEAGLRKALDDPDPDVQRVLPRLFALTGTRQDFRYAKALSDLKSDDKARRIAGAGQLTRTPVDDARRKEVADLLRPLLDAEDAEVKSAARDAFVRWAAKDDLPALIKMLGAGGTTQQQRMALIDSLGASKDAKAIEALVPLVGGAESFFAEQALIKAGAEAEKPVRKLLDSTDPKVRTPAARILKGIGIKDNFEFESAWGDARSDDARRRLTGLITLGNTVTVPDGKKADVLKLAEKLKDDTDPATRQQAVFLLAKYATKDQVPALLKLMEGKADGQRAHVIVALGRLKEESAAPLIVKCLGEPTERTVADKALTDIGSASEKPLLAELKDSEKTLTRISCVRVLGKVGTKESLTALENIAADANPRSRALVTEAKQAIEAIKKR